MKKLYHSPELEIEKFIISAMITTSDNPGDGTGDNGEIITPGEDF